MIQTQDRARAVEDLTLGRKGEMDAAIDVPEGDAPSDERLSVRWQHRRERLHADRAPAAAAGAPFRRALGAAVDPARRPGRPFAAGRPVVYVLEKRSVVDVAVLEYVCRERGLPPPLAPPAPAACRPSACCSSSGAPGSSACASTGACPSTARACAAAATDLAFDVDIVPVSLFWGRAPGRERSWFRLLVAEGWDIGGRFRKVLSLLVNGRNLLCCSARRCRCSPSLGETRGLPAARAGCRASCAAQFRNQRVASIGPDLSHRRTIVTQVLQDRRWSARPCAARCRPRASAGATRSRWREATRRRSRPTTRTGSSR